MRKIKYLKRFLAQYKNIFPLGSGLHFAYQMTFICNGIILYEICKNMVNCVTYLEIFAAFGYILSLLSFFPLLSLLNKSKTPLESISFQFIGISAAEGLNQFTTILKSFTLFNLSPIGRIICIR